MLKIIKGSCPRCLKEWTALPRKGKVDERVCPYCLYKQVIEIVEE